MAETRRRRFTPKQKAYIVSRLLEDRTAAGRTAEEYGIHPIQLQRWKSRVQTNMHKLFEKEAKELEKLKAEYEQRIEEMRAEMAKLNQQLEWLKQVAVQHLPKANRSDLVRREDTGLPIRTQTELLGVSRSTLYYRLNHPGAGISPSKTGPIVRRGNAKPVFPSVGLNIEQIRQVAELDLPKLKIQNGWMDVFGGFH